MTVIDFLYRGAPFSGETMRSASLGGIESSIVQLSEALARRGHDVTVFNGVSSERREFGVQWLPVGEALDHSRGEIGIAVASPMAFGETSFRSRIFWLHNPLKSWRTIRRGDVGPLLANRPHFVICGAYHATRVPRWLPSRGRTIIHHGIQEDFFRREPAPGAPQPRAIFTSQPYRGLDWLLGLWDEIKRQVPAAAFEVFAPKIYQAAANARRHALEGIRSGAVSRVPISHMNWRRRACN